MKREKIKIDLQKRRVFFCKNLPSYNQLIKTLPLKGVINKEKESTVVNKELQQIRNKSDALASPLVICDRQLQSFPEVQLWLKDYSTYITPAGEKLKSIDNFPKHISNILKKTKNKSISAFISLGGGSVGDFTGFLAGIYKRGRPLIHIPTTWLSAMDSAHGGKTALNVPPFKNLLGSYCFPKAVFIVKPLLFSLPEKENETARGELIKMALITGGSFYRDVSKKEVFTHKDLWYFLPQVIYSKLKIVKQDPYDKKDVRCLLNFGHTLGHALDLYFKIPHGEAVTYGMMFALQWSHKRFTLSSSFLEGLPFPSKAQKKMLSYLKKIPPQILYTLLLQDKKRMREKRINFVFIKSPGKVFLENVFVKDIIREVKRQIS